MNTSDMDSVPAHAVTITCSGLFRANHWIYCVPETRKAEAVRNALKGPIWEKVVERGRIGVKIDASQPWADAFRRALSFWNTVLAANFHEETNLNACSVRIISGGPAILETAVIARAQLTERDNFRAMIAVKSEAAKTLSSDELYATAEHEFGHMLGLKHNASSRSIMYFLDVDGTEVLDSKDILDLSTHHEVRAAVVATGFLPVKVVLAAVPMHSGSISTADEGGGFATR
jgi:hypothetical protein